MTTLPAFELVDSSNVHGLYYEPAAKRLWVAFRGEVPMRVYQHEGVSQSEYDALIGHGITGHSVGKHYSAQIKSRYPSKRVQYEGGNE